MIIKALDEINFFFLGESLFYIILNFQNLIWNFSFEECSFFLVL